MPWQTCSRRILMSLSPEDIHALQELSRKSAESFGSGDMAAWAAVYAEDGVLMPPNGPTVVGRANVLAFGESFTEIAGLSFGDFSVQGEGDLAVGWSSYQLGLVGEDGVEVNDTGKQLVVFERQADGGWLVTRAMFNSDLEPQ